MNTQISLIQDEEYEYFSVKGKPISKKQRVRDAIINQNQTGEKLCDDKDFEDATEEEVAQFNEWLSSFQEDLRKIVGKHRKANHVLSHEEIISEINISLIKKRDHLVDYMHKNGGFNEQNFKKSAFVYSRNLTKWSHLSITNKSYHKRRDDRVFYDKDGDGDDPFKTSYELAIDTQGESPEDDPNHFVNVEQMEKIANHYRVIKEYYNILTVQEIKILSMLEKGMTEKEMSAKIGITHQAVNYAKASISKKIASYMRFDQLNDTNFHSVCEGNKAINSFFSSSPDTPRIAEEHSLYLQEFIILNAKKFTLQDVTAHINDKFKSSYTTKQICTSLNMRNLYHSHILKTKLKPRRKD